MTPSVSMGAGILVANGAVRGARDDAIVSHDHRAHRHFAGRGALGRGGERLKHPPVVA